MKFHFTHPTFLTHPTPIETHWNALFGTTKSHRLAENLDGTDVRLTAEDLAQIQTTLSHIQIVGERYSVAAQGLINRSNKP